MRQNTQLTARWTLAAEFNGKAGTRSRGVGAASAVALMCSGRADAGSHLGPHLPQPQGFGWHGVCGEQAAKSGTQHDMHLWLLNEGGTEEVLRYNLLTLRS